MRVWFIVPVHGREALSAVCLRQLRRTIDAIDWLEAEACVIGEGRLLELAASLGFATVERNNDQLGRKFNDGFELATSLRFNPEPADYVVPCGSDDWIDPAILRHLPEPNTIGIFRQLSVVSEDRTRIVQLRVGYKGGCGIRLIPAGMIARCGHRPCQEDRQRACDTSTLEGIKKVSRGRFPEMTVLDIHPLQIVDFKSSHDQLNSYRTMVGFRRQLEASNVWSQLASVYPAESIEEMAAL